MPGTQIRGSIAVSISACHAEDPGSIPGRGESSELCCGVRAHTLAYWCLRPAHWTTQPNRTDREDGATAHRPASKRPAVPPSPTPAAARRRDTKPNLGPTTPTRESHRRGESICRAFWVFRALSPTATPCLIHWICDRDPYTRFGRGRSVRGLLAGMSYGCRQLSRVPRSMRVPLPCTFRRAALCRESDSNGRDPAKTSMKCRGRHTRSHELAC